MIVEDDADIRMLLTRGLTRAGFEVTSADNGVTAMQRLAADGTPDAVLVDLLMPLMDGIRFLQWLRTDARLRIPVLVITSSSDAGAEAEARRAGCTRFIAKPFQMKVVVAVLDELLADETRP
jgi:CheY-like chemotaxis protein